jgi:hypothetical protein
VPSGPEPLTVAFTVSTHREKYLRQTLESWARVRGLRHNVTLLFCIEPNRNFPEMEFSLWVRRAFPNTARVILSGTEWLGCFRNTRHAMATAFRYDASFAVLAEEDTLVAEDILEYYRWAADRFRGDQRVMAVCAHSFACQPDAGHYDATFIPWFSPIGWGTWKDVWDEVICPEWAGAEGNPDAWDLHLRQQLQAGGFGSVFPLRSRTQHIGELSSLTRYPLSEYFYKQSVSSCYQDICPPGAYTEVERPAGLTV